MEMADLFLNECSGLAENSYLSFMESEFDKVWETSREREEGPSESNDLFASPKGDADSGLGSGTPPETMSFNLSSMEPSPESLEGHLLTEDDFMLSEKNPELTWLPLEHESELDAVSQDSPVSVESSTDHDAYCASEKRARSGCRDSVDNHSASHLRCKRKRKYEEEPQADPVAEKSRLNALFAKKNREKKKRQLADLEEQVAKLTKDKQTLVAENQTLKSLVEKRERQISYLKGVIANSTPLATVLRGLTDMEGVQLGVSFGGKENGRRPSSVAAGVCVHVNGSRTSLEFCAECSGMASDAEDARSCNSV